MDDKQKAEQDAYMQRLYALQDEINKQVDDGASSWYQPAPRRAYIYRLEPAGAASPQDSHTWCIIGLSKKEIGLALGLPDEPKIAEAVNALCQSTGIVLRPKDPNGPRHQKTWFVALDTVPKHLLPRFTQAIGMKP
jgi:hypothetical protein